MADYRRDYEYPGRHVGYRVWMPRERGGYWRQYEDRAPLDQKRAEDVAGRVSGVKDVTNQLRVSREAIGHAQTATLPVSQRFIETPSKSTSGNSA